MVLLDPPVGNTPVALSGMELNGGHLPLTPFFRRYQAPTPLRPGPVVSFPWDRFVRRLPPGTPQARFAQLAENGTLATATGKALQKRVNDLVGNHQLL